MTQNTGNGGEALLRSGSWSDQETEQVKALCASRTPYSEISGTLNRSIASVRVKVGRLGISNGRPLGGGPGPRAATHVGCRAMEIGTAGEMLVCVDLLLAGHKAFLSSQGLSYDVVAEINGRLIRVAVKSCQRATARPEREGGRVCYQYRIYRGSQNAKRKSAPYTRLQCDLLALAALDVRSVAYIFAPSGVWLTAMHIDPPGSEYGGRSRGGYRRKRWEDFTLERALSGLATEARNG